MRRSDLDKRMDDMYRREFVMHAEEFEHQSRYHIIERVRELEKGLKDLLEDTQHVDHDCGDKENCPVLLARKLLQGHKE